MKEREFISRSKYELKGEIRKSYNKNIIDWKEVMIQYVLCWSQDKITRNSEIISSMLIACILKMME